MKRIITLMLSAALTFALVAPAAAVEFKGFGDMTAGFVYLDNVNDGFSKGKTDHFMAHNRVRIGVEVIASENLKGVFYVTTNNMRWGDDARFGNVMGANGGPFVRQAYLDWRIPSTPVRLKMGEQIVVLPGAMGSPILHTAVPAVTANIKASDNVSVNVGWARLGDSTGQPAGLEDVGMDLFFVTVPLSFNGFNVTPWGSYAMSYENSSGTAGAFPADTKVYHMGVNLDATVIEKLRIRGDFMYGSLDNGAAGPALDTAGWFTDLKVTYQFGFGELGAVGWYSSGSKDNAKKGKHMPTFGGTAWGLNNTEENGFGPTSFLSFGNGPLVTGQFVTKTGIGTLGIGAVLENVSFVEKLAHNFRLVYWKGTNKDTYTPSAATPQGGNPLNYIDKKTSIIEANIDTRYQIYPGFTTFFEIGLASVDWSKALKYDVSGDKRKTFGYRIGWAFHYAF